jgi:hypothetical protein
MKFEIKPGTLCFIKGETGWCTPNNGKVVAVVRMGILPKSDGRFWECVCQSALNGWTWPDKHRAMIAPGEEHIMPECALIPIAGPNLEADVRHYDTKRLSHLQEKKRVHAISYGATIEQIRSL